MGIKIFNLDNLKKDEIKIKYKDVLYSINRPTPQFMGELFLLEEQVQKKEKTNLDVFYHTIDFLCPDIKHMLNNMDETEISEINEILASVVFKKKL